MSDSDPSPDSFSEHLLRTHNEAYQAYDRAIMSLSGGALGISLVFIHDVAPHPTHRWLIALSWGFLTVSLLLVIASFLASQWAIERALGRRWGHRAEDERDRSQTLTAIFNFSAGGTFVLGVVFLVLFAVYNLGHG